MNIIKAYRYERPYTTAAATTKAAIHTLFSTHRTRTTLYSVDIFLNPYVNVFSTDVFDKSKYSECAEEKNLRFPGFNQQVFRPSATHIVRLFFGPTSGTLFIMGFSGISFRMEDVTYDDPSTTKS